MSYLPLLPPADETVPTFEAIREKFGFLPNFFQAQTRRPDFIEAQATLLGTVFMKGAALPRLQREYIFLCCSAANLSTYCVTAHCEIVRMLGLEGPAPEEVALDYASTDLPMATKALLSFALKLNANPSRIQESDIEDLRTFGYTDAQIHEAVVAVAVAHFTNVVSLGLGTVPDFDNPLLAAMPRP